MWNTTLRRNEVERFVSLFISATVQSAKHTPWNETRSRRLWEPQQSYYKKRKQTAASSAVFLVIKDNDIWAIFKQILFFFLKKRCKLFWCSGYNCYCVILQLRHTFLFYFCFNLQCAVSLAANTVPRYFAFHVKLVPPRKKRQFLPDIFHMEKAWNESLCEAIGGLDLMVSASTEWKSFISAEPCSEGIFIVFRNVINILLWIYFMHFEKQRHWFKNTIQQ